jgi:hypothetical protein
LVLVPIQDRLAAYFHQEARQAFPRQETALHLI